MLKSIKIISNISAGLLIFVGGYLLSKKVNKVKISNAGNLRIDNSEPDEPPKLFLELTKNLQDICNSDVITLNVIEKDYLDSKNIM